ncbi:DNA polymerase III subunit alpha [Agilicoccus flavus]|uniref:DNA polymerase III subunit alpha n=1 Tax=Agilicoccus flavus TaxID=2775968 RepID=UPI001CF6DD3A|nr:PHP domain-containing protein [Agilicoccus flavus]
MSDGFAHLHVASSASLRYGVSTPADLVEQAVAHGQPALALTDRDGLYGAVRFVQACAGAGLAPVLGVDLACLPDDSGPHPAPSRGADAPTRRAPARGGMAVDPRHPRVVVLARGEGAGVGAGEGWARLCRLVTATHLRGERGRPITGPALLAEHARAGGRPGAPTDPLRGRDAAAPAGPSPLLVLLGPDSDVGRAVLAGRREQARALLAAWAQLLPPDALAVELVHHRAPDGSPRSVRQARRMRALAVEAGLPCVLTAAVRHATPEQAATVDVLDAARRLAILDERHLDRVSTAGYLAPGRAMYPIAFEITGDRGEARRLMDTGVEIARECALDPRRDVGIGAVHLPEPEAIGLAPGDDPQRVLARRCHESIGRRYPGASVAHLDQVAARLDDELAVVAALGYPTYFLTVAGVVDLVRDMGVRVAARGSGAGSLVNHLLGISGVDPMRHGLLMERFCTPLRAQLPDIDLDVESARRTQVYEAILDRLGGERVTCVSMSETYRVRHAIRDVGAALGLPPVEVDAIAKAFPHIRARDARAAIADLPELSSLGLGGPKLQVLFDLVERLDGLPRHLALHPCGIVLSNASLLDRTPVEASWLGFPMSQFDKDDVETLGLLKLDVLGIRMQSAMAHAVAEVERVDGVVVDLDDRAQVPFDDPATFDLVRSAATLGCFQIESPGQRELIGKFAPETFDDLIIDISLFRPGPVNSDMITPFLRARQGWSEPDLLHPSLAGALAETCGVVVFHEQVLRIVATTTGIDLAEADEVRRALGTVAGRERVEAWWRPAARARGYAGADVDRIWEVLAAFGSFGFCKAHAAAFALPTYQSAWLKTHHRAAFLAGVLTHDPGMYPKRLILDDARVGGITVLGLDVNVSDGCYRYERVEPDGRPGIRVSLSDVKGMSEAELARIVAARPYVGLPDFWARSGVSRPVAERLVLAGAFDALYGLDGGGLGRRGGITRRDLLLHVAELERWTPPGRSGRSGRRRGAGRPVVVTASDGTVRLGGNGDGDGRDDAGGGGGGAGRAAGPLDVRRSAAAQSQAPAAVRPAAEQPAQLLLDLGAGPELRGGSGLPDMSEAERVHAELDVLGLDVSGHVIDPYLDLLETLGVVRSSGLRQVRTRREVLVAGVKVATQTPPIRSGRRVVFLTLEDATGPIDATFFEDVQGPYAATVFSSWLLLVRGVVRRTGPMGVSVRATGAWELTALQREWETGGPAAVQEMIAGSASGDADHHGGAGGRTEVGSGPRRVLVHPSGFRVSPYADVRPAGEGAQAPLRKLWHSSPGSSGR